MNTALATERQEQNTQQENTQPNRNERWFQPSVDILETPTGYVMYVNLPGATQESLDLQYEHGVLSLHAAVAPRQSEDQKFLLREFGVGDFHRTFRLGESIDASNISAQLANGVLKLDLPKTTAALPRKIEVKCGE